MRMGSLLLGTALLLAVCLPGGVAAPPRKVDLRGMKVLRRATIPRSRGRLDVLSSDLRRLLAYFESSGVEREGSLLTAEAIRRRYGIAPGSPRPAVEVAIELAPGATTAGLKAAGATPRFRVGSLVYAGVPVDALRAVAELTEVVHIGSISSGSLPEPVPPLELPAVGAARTSRGPATSGGTAARPATPLTGKGVAVVVIDSSIDWKHADFRSADGSSRIVALWDMSDPTFADGKGGSKPPASDPETGKPLGTVYTREQLDQGILGTGVVGSKDRVGHGTACAGIAAGGGPPENTHRGLAPAASLIVVNAADGVEGRITGAWPIGTIWAIQTAKKLGLPCVVNQSFGNHFTAKDGSDETERLLNQLSGAGKPGVIICASAGNEGRESIISGGRFGPSRAGQQDVYSQPTEVFLKEPGPLNAYFNREEDWGLVVIGLDNFLVDEKQRSMAAHFYSVGDKIRIDLRGPADAKPAAPANFQQFVLEEVDFEAVNKSTVRAQVNLPAGSYLVAGFGPSANVRTGRYMLVLPQLGTGSFGRGVQKTALVGSPGNASSVITVGAYNFRSSWRNNSGSMTYFSSESGSLAEYSSPGYRRDGYVKPDISGPGSWAISSLGQGSKMALEADASMLTPDGTHIAWQGTSAATPFVTGVVALMLQKNPRLDAEQVRKILRDTAKKDSFTGNLPNPSWGWGKLDPAAALKAVPLPGAKPPAKPKARPAAGKS